MTCRCYSQVLVGFLTNCSLYQIQWVKLKDHWPDLLLPFLSFPFPIFYWFSSVFSCSRQLFHIFPPVVQTRTSIPNTSTYTHRVEFMVLIYLVQLCTSQQKLQVISMLSVQILCSPHGVWCQLLMSSSSVALQLQSGSSRPMKSRLIFWILGIFSSSDSSVRV